MKLTTVSIVAVATLTLAACGSGTHAAAPPSTTARTTSTTDLANDANNDRMAESNLRNAFTAAKVAYTDNSDYSNLPNQSFLANRFGKSGVCGG